MAQVPCALTREYLKTLLKYVGEVGWYLYDDLKSDFEELQELAEENRPHLTALKLRGFYAVEVLYHQVLPKLALPRAPSKNLRKGVRAAIPSLDGLIEGGQKMEEYHTWRFPRSYEGLTALITVMRELMEDTEVEDIALQLDGRILPAVRSMRADLNTPWKEVLVCTEKLAEDLRRQLSPEGTALWPAIGARFASACLAANEEMSDCLVYARRLLAINQENAITPWNP